MDRPFKACREEGGIYFPQPIFISREAQHFLLKTMLSVLSSSAVDRGFDPRSGQTKEYEIGISPLSTQHQEN